MQFRDRIDSADQLAKKIMPFAENSIIYALPRGGVVVGAELAKKLNLPLDLILVRKIGHQWDPEFALCAVAEGREPICSEDVDFNEKWFKDALTEEIEKNKQRRRKYFDEQYKQPDATNKTAVIVDDGIATGLTMLSAVDYIRSKKPSSIIVAVPVAPADSIDELKRQVDKVIVIDDPANFAGAVGAHYQNFPQVEDEEVVELLKEASK